MTNEQRETFIQNRGNGATLREAASMVGVTWRHFVERVWRPGALDLEHERESEEAAFVKQARAASALHCASKRAEAHAAAGSRESADLLAYVKALESEQEPSLEEQSNSRQSVDLMVSDALENGGLGSVEHAELAAQHEAFTRAGLAMFDLLLQSKRAV